MLPQIPNPPRPPPPIPLDSNRSRTGQTVPINWVITSVSPSGMSRSGPDQRQKRLSVAKSMDNLRSRKNIVRPAIREANSSAGSFMHLDMTSPYPQSSTQLNQSSRPSKLTPQNSNDTSQGQNRLTGSIGQDSGSGSLLTPHTWRAGG